VNPALLFLIHRTAVTAIRSRLARLKQVRYLVPAVIGLAYFVLIFGGSSLREGRPRHDSFSLPDPFMEWGGAVLILLMALLVWILPGRQPAIAFLEPEVAILFPAPLTRRELVTYKLLDLQKVVAIAPLIFGVMTWFQGGPARAVYVAAGVWFTVNVLTLHQVGARFALEGIAGHGVSGLRRHAPVLLVVAAFFAVLVLGVPPLPSLEDVAERHGVARWLAQLEHSPAGWALYPFRALVLLPLATDPATFLVRLLPVVALLALLYAWVIRADVAFEESAAEFAVDLSRRIEAAKKGKFSLGGAPRLVRRSRWPLRPVGPPETAFAWKCVSTSFRSVTPSAVWLLVAGVAAAGIVAFAMPGTAEPPNRLALTIAGVLAAVSGILMFAGPAVLGAGLRQDLEQVETLKVLPVPGPRLVRASLAGAVVPIAVLQALLIAFAVAVAPPSSKVNVTLEWRLAAFLAGALVLPSLTALSASLDAAGAILFPAWIRPGTSMGQGGVEGMGMSIVTLLGKTVGMGFGCIAPAVLGGGTAAAVVILAPEPLRPAGVALGGILAAGALLVEVWVLTEWLGGRFDRLDPAAEGMIS